MLDLRLDRLDILLDYFHLLFVVDGVVNGDLLDPHLLVAVKLEVLAALRVEEVVLVAILVVQITLLAHI